MKRNEILKYGLFALVGATIVYFIQKDFRWSEFVANLKQANIALVVLSTLVGVLAVLFRALRWQLILEPLGYKTKLGNAYHSTMSGYLVNLGIPRAGEFSRCAMLSKSDNVPVYVLIGTVLSERILDIIMLLIVIISAVMIQFDVLFSYIDEKVLSKLKDNTLVLIIGVAFLLGLLVVAFKAKKIFSAETAIGKAAIGLFDGVKSIFTVKKPVLFVLYTVGIWVCYLMMTYFILLAFSFTADMGISGGLSTLVFSSLGVIIPAPAGSATVSSVYIGLNEIYNLPIQQAKAIGLVMFSANILMIIVSGTISYIIMAGRTKV